MADRLHSVWKQMVCLCVLLRWQVEWWIDLQETLVKEVWAAYMVFSLWEESHSEEAAHADFVAWTLVGFQGLSD